MKRNPTAGGEKSAHAGGGYFEISPGKRKIDKVVDDEEKPILTLKPFSARPQISFKRVLVNSEVTKTLYIYNPDASDVSVEVIGSVPADRHLELHALKVVVPSVTEVPFLLTWKPKEPGSWCDTLNFKDSRGRRGAVLITYEAISPKKSKTTSFRGVTRGALKTHGTSRKSTQILSKPTSKPHWKAPLPVHNPGTQQHRTQLKTNSWKTVAALNGNLPSVNVPSTPRRRETYNVPKHSLLKNNENYHDLEILDTENAVFVRKTGVAKISSPKRQPLTPLPRARSHLIGDIDPNVSVDSLDLTPVKTQEAHPKFLDKLNVDFMFSPVVTKQHIQQHKETGFYNDSTFFEKGIISQSQFTSINEMTFPDLSFASRRCSTASKEVKQVNNEESPKFKASTRELMFSPGKEQRLSSDTYVLSSFEGLSGESVLIPVCSPSSCQHLPKVTEVSEQAEQNWSIQSIHTQRKMQLAHVLEDQLEDSLEKISPTENIKLHAAPSHLQISQCSVQDASKEDEKTKDKTSNSAPIGFATFDISPPKEKMMVQATNTTNTYDTTKPSTSGTLFQISPPKPFKVPKVDWIENEENQNSTCNKSDGSACQNKTYNVTPSSSIVKPMGLQQIHVPVGLSQKLKLVTDKNTATPVPEKYKFNRDKLVPEGVKIHDPEQFLYEYALSDICMPGSKNDPFYLNPLLCEAIFLKYKIDFTKWLNSVLTPPEELGSEEVIKVNAAELWSRSTKTGAVEVLAPSRELVSSRYLAVSSRLDHLRRAACNMFQQPKMAEVLCSVTSRIDSGKLKIRDDKSLHLNQGLKQQVLSLFLAYNPLWLRIGLETVVGYTIPLASNSDLNGLSHFIVQRLLSAEAVVGKSHLLLQREYKDIFNKYVLKKFLLLVYFLDQAKTKKLIRHDPCLFRKNSDIKSSKDLLLSFSRLLLAGEGDVTRHLGYMGYKVNHQQSFLDEYPYSVSHIEVDLRDGIRLTRVVELVTGCSDLSIKLRVPPVSRLQKIHNVNVALQGLKNAGYEVQNLQSADIVAGHREKTMSLLWQILHKFQLPRFENSARIIQKWWLHPSLKTVIARRINLKKREKACITIQKFTRGLLCRKKIMALINEARTVKIHHEKALVIQRNVRSFLFRKKVSLLVDECHKIRAALIIQRNAKLFLLKRRVKALALQAQLQQAAQQEAAALKIQSYWRSFMAQKQLTVLKKDHEVKQLAATKIQCLVRCFVAKRLLQKLKSEAVMKNDAVLILQRFWRCYKAKKILRILKQQHQELRQSSALMIQCAWRSYTARKILHHLNCEKIVKQQAAATTIQNVWRSYLARKLLMQLREENLKKQKAAVTIQCFWRCLLSRRTFSNLLLEYKLRYESALNIQCAWRCYIAKKILNRLKQDEYTRKTSAAETLQRSWRCFKSRQLLHQLKFEYETKRKSSALTIQCAFRRYCARNQLACLKREFLERNSAAQKIQSCWRCFAARKILINLKQIYDTNRANAAIKIQCAWRCHHSRQVLALLKKEDFETKTSAAEVIQCSWRCYKAKQVLINLKEQLEVKKNHSAFKIQCAWRCHHSRQVLALLKKEDFETKTNAAEVIQCSWRCYKAKQVLINLKEQLEVKKNHSALKIQCAWRCHHSRQVLALLKKEDFETKTNAAEVIQCSWRCYKAKQVLINLKEQLEVKKNHSAFKIQCAWRCHHSRQVLALLKKEDFETKTNAAEVIQCSWRCYKAKQVLINLKEQLEVKKNHSALKIQCAWRCHHSRQVLALLKKEDFETKTNAAEVIQCSWRCYKAKQVLINLKEQLEVKKNHSALKIQCAWRCHHSRQVLALLKKEDFDTKTNAAEVIQRSWHCYLARQVLTDLKEQLKAKKNNSAIKIQCAWRCHHSRQVLALLKKKDFETKTKAAEVLQRSWRCYLAGRVLTDLKEQLEAKKNHSALKIQCAWRCHHSRQVLALLKEEDLKRKVCAVETVQRSWRCYKARQILILLKEEYETKKNISALIIQCAWRCHYSRQVLALLKKEDFETKTKAAGVIQRSWRCYKARQVLTDLKEQLEAMKNKSAVKIQCAWKCHQSRQVLALLKEQSLRRKVSAVETVQRSWRCYKARQILILLKEEHETKKNISALIIQCAWRSCLSRKLLLHLKQHDRERKEAAATCIQSFWRCCVARQVLHHLKQEHQAKKNSCALKIQCAWRCHQARATLSLLKKQEFERKVSAGETIQRFWRCYRARKTQSELKCAYEKKVEAAIVIQCAWRQNKALKIFSQLKEIDSVRREAAALKIQLRWRCYSAKKTIHKLRQELVVKRERAATVIQSLWRCHKARHLLLEQRQMKSAIMLQCWWRRLLAKKQLRQLKEEDNCKRNTAAVSIQCSWRCFVARQQLKLLKMKLLKKRCNAALKIQCCWRCYTSRRMLAKLKQNRDAKQSAAAITIQCAWRCYTSRTILHKLNALKLLKLAKSATCIQSAWRSFQAKKLVDELKTKRILSEENEKRSRAAITIQKAVRNWMWQKAVSFYLQEKKTSMLSARILQAWEEILIKSPRENVNPATLASILKEQHFIKQKRKIATKIIQRHWKKYIYKKLHAALKIQALWRGYKCRKNNLEAAAAKEPIVISVGEQELVIAAENVAKVVERKERIQEVTRNAKVEDRIAWKIKFALNALWKTKAHDIYAMSIFEYYLTISETCVPMILPALDYIVDVLEKNNRSVPAMEIALPATGALLSLAKHPISQPVLWNFEKLVPTLLIMLKISKTNDKIFNNVCTILWLMAMDPTKVQDLLNQSNLNYQLRTLYTSMQVKQKVTRSQKKQPVLPLPTPRFNKEPRRFSTKIHGLHTLMKTLNIPIPI